MVLPVTDKDAAYTRRIALEEGIFVGNQQELPLRDYCN
jgi:hypothetical protein